MSQNFEQEDTVSIESSIDLFTIREYPKNLENMVEQIPEDNKQYLNYYQSDKKIQNLIDNNTNNSYPIIYCSVHKLPVILFCLRTKCEYRILICSKCISAQLMHINKHTPLSVPQQFWRFVNGDDRIGIADLISPDQFTVNLNIDELSRQMILAANSRIDLFLNHIDLKLQKQKTIFIRQQNNLENLKIFGKSQQNKFLDQEEIINIINNIKNQKELDDYLKSIIMQKQKYDSATTQLKNYNKRCQDYYKNILDKCTNKKPILQSQKMVNSIENYLQEIFSNLTKDSMIENSISNNLTYIDVKIQKIEDLANLHPHIIKPQTKLTIQLSRLSESNKIQAYKYISKLPIQGLIVNARSSKLLMFPYFLPTTCKLFTFDFYATQLKVDHLKNIQQMFENFESKKVIQFNLMLGKNQLKCESMKYISLIINNMKNLRNLNLDLRYNYIKDLGARFLGQSLRNLKKLRKFQLNLNSFSLQKNQINDVGALQIITNLQSLLHLNELILRFNQNKIGNPTIKLLGKLIKKTQNLISLTLDLSDNKIHLESILSLVKKISNSHIKQLFLNLSSIKCLNYKNIEKILDFLSNSYSLEIIGLNLKNCGIQVHQINIAKGKLINYFEKNGERSSKSRLSLQL